MRTPPARYGAAAAVLALALCTHAPARAAAPTRSATPVAPTPSASPAVPAESTDSTDSAASAGQDPAAAAGAELAARRAAARPLAFGPCPTDEQLPDGVGCARLRVPLDYTRPDGPQISLTVSRLPAGGGTTGHKTAHRQGALVFNPGGPGASGTFFPAVAGLPEWRRISAAYDLVGYAPRGVGGSAPLSCRSPAEHARAPRQDPAAPSAAYKRERVALARAYARGCAERAGTALAHYTTLDNVRDLHVLRAALGERRLNFLGASYGTYFGAVYATLYPGHVRRLVFDSAVNPDPRHIWYRNNLDQSAAFERRWYDFRAWTARHHATYGLGATPAAVRASWERVREVVARRPAGGLVGTGELQAAYLKAAYYDEVWPQRAAALAAFLAGDPEPLVELAAPDPERAAEEENATAVYTAVLCNDASWPADFAVWDRDHTELARRAPFETWPNAWLNLPCAYWPVTDRQQPVDVGAFSAAGTGATGAGAETGADRAGLPPVLIVAAERDAATPYAGALELQRRLGPAAALVTEVGAGAHGVVGGRNACVDRHVERYLLTGDTAGPRSECAPHPEPAPVSLDGRAAATVRSLPPPAV
ncbi:alpha/beta fold hydrolase [Streptomyces sp. NPDC089799]|uniref:alpha/beta fold hydrolase n=1 Tax=Streptomyces sp. NPDC089799 TaxID=3155066 RepID=UPI00344A8C28